MLLDNVLRRNELTKKINSALVERLAEAEEWQKKTENIIRTSKSFSIETQAVSKANVGFSAAHGYFRIALTQLIGVTHDVEIVRSEKAILNQAGIDLDRLIPTRQIDLGLNHIFKIEQSGKAITHYEHFAECLVVDQGQMGIDVPLKITDLNLSYDARINLTLGIQHLPGSNSALIRFVAKQPSFCPPGNLAPEMQTLMLDELQDVVDNLGGIVRLPRLPELQLGKFYQYGAMLGTLTRVHGEVRKRSRTFLQPISHLSNWADSALKLHISIFTDQVKNRIAVAGVELRSGFRYAGNNSYDVTVGASRNKSVKVGCIEFGARVNITIVLRTQLRIDPNQSLIVDTWIIYKNVDVKVQPRPLGWLFSELEKWGEQYIERKIPNITNTERISLNSARRAEIKTNADTVLIEMQTRRLFME